MCSHTMRDLCWVQTFLEKPENIFRTSNCPCKYGKKEPLLYQFIIILSIKELSFFKNLNQLSILNIFIQRKL